jgi:hypothetical protein
MTKHSPGPYTPKRSGDGKCTLFFTQDERICEPVFVVDHDDITEEGASVVKANMKLLAAAPELLEALKLAEQWLEGWASAEPELAVVRAAIAKAE